MSNGLILILIGLLILYLSVTGRLKKVLQAMYE
jgi:hypothetical protein